MISVITPTHNDAWLSETWQSLVLQRYTDFEWIVAVNDREGAISRIKSIVSRVQDLVYGDSRVKIVQDLSPGANVGARKRTAFAQAKGDVVLELDHDDLLLPDALGAVAAAFDNPEVGFAYSDTADFADAGGQPVGLTYHDPAVRAGWLSNGFEFYEATVGGPRPGKYEFVKSFKPTASAVGLIFYAPNHLRAWRRKVYETIGGHDPTLEVCDDHDLILRTYLATRCEHIPQPLYLYRITGQNTWSKSIEKIRGLTYNLRERYLEQLVLRQCELLGLPAYDLGAAISPRAGWTSVDIRDGAAVKADLRAPWPWKDNSVGAFRASDLLEHLPDKQHTMSEIHRCLVHGGWLMSMTPSTDGRGAFMDPTHVSYWTEPSFWYWTRRNQAQYIGNTNVRFMETQLYTGFPSQWYKDNNISYVTANLVALKDGPRLPGEISI